MGRFNKIKLFCLVSLAVGIIVSLLSCGKTGNNINKVTDEESIAPFEIFIQGAGMDFRRVMFNGNGSRLLTSGEKGTTIWDLGTNREIKTLFKGETQTEAISKSGRYIITFSRAYQGNIKITDLSNLKIRSLKILSDKESGRGDGIYGISISDDEHYFALGINGAIRLFDLETLQQINEIKLEESHYPFGQGLCFLPGTGRVLSVSFNLSYNTASGQFAYSEPSFAEPDNESSYLINVWDENSEKPLFSHAFVSNYIFSWSASNNGNEAAFLFNGNKIKIIDIASGKEENHEPAFDGQIDKIAFGADNNIVLADYEGLVGVYDRRKHETQIIDTAELKKNFNAPACSDLAISGDGSRIVFINAYEKLILFDLETKEINRISDKANNILGAFFDSDSFITIFTPGGIFRQNGPNFNVSKARISQFYGSISADQVWIKNTDTEETKVFDLSLAETIPGGNIEPEDSCAGITQDGRYAFHVESGRGEDNSLRIIDLQNKHANPVLLENSGDYIQAFDHNHKVLCRGWNSRMLSVWDMQSGRLLSKLNGTFDTAVAFDENRCLASTRDTVRMIDLNSGSVIRTYTPVNQNEGGDIMKIAPSKDKKHFATGSYRGMVTIWSVDNDHELITFATHKSMITSLAFSPDSRFILSGSYYGRSMVMNEVATGREIARFVSFSDGEWIIITPEGYFNASENGAAHLNVRVGGEVYSVDNFYEKYYNPAYLASVLRGNKAEAVSDIRKGVATPPGIKIVSPATGAEFSTEEITVTISAKDTGGGIDEIRLYQNGKALGEATRGIKVAGTGGDVLKSYAITLVDGINTLRATGFSRDRTESNPDEITVTLAARPKEVSLHVLTVGINTYENPALSLNYAQPDAKGIVDFFRQNGNELFKNVDIKDCYNEQATKERILADLRELENTSPQDAVLIFMAGHGENIDDKWYFIPYELTYPEREEEVKQKAVSSDELSTYIRNIQAQKILVLIDACKSGAALLAFRGFEDRKALSQLSRATGVHIVAASTKNQYATEVKELGHGVFTYTLLEGLSGGAAASGEPVTVRRLMGYIEEQLPELTKKYRQEAQYPVVDSRGMDFPLVVAK